MSAWVCSDSHISAIVGWWLNFCKNNPHYQNKWGTDAQALADKLLAQNYRSVYDRYEDRAEGYFGLPQQCAYDNRFQFKPVNSIILLKLLDCYDYQACETDDWKETEAVKFTADLREHAISKLTGKEGISYEDAPWGIDSFDFMKEIKERQAELKRIREAYKARRA